MEFPSNVNRNTTDYRQTPIKMGLRLGRKVLRKHKLKNMAAKHCFAGADSTGGCNGLW
jgi:hypothetical protein